MNLKHRLTHLLLDGVSALIGFGSVLTWVYVGFRYAENGKVDTVPDLFSIVAVGGIGAMLTSTLVGLAWQPFAYLIHPEPVVLPDGWHMGERAWYIHPRFPIGIFRVTAYAPAVLTVEDAGYVDEDGLTRWSIVRQHAAENVAQDALWVTTQAEADRQADIPAPENASA